MMNFNKEKLTKKENKVDTCATRNTKKNNLVLFIITKRPLVAFKSSSLTVSGNFLVILIRRKNTSTITKKYIL